MTNQEKRDQWRFYFALYFQDSLPAPWKEGRAVVANNAGNFADVCVGEEEKRFADLRPDPPPLLPVPEPPVERPYR